MKTVRFTIRTLLVTALLLTLTLPAVFSQDRSMAAKPAATAKAPAAKIESGKVVNINQATLNQLIEIKGVGPVMAQRIVEFREKNGPFKKLEDLLSVKGIGEKKLEKMRNQLSL